MTKTGHHDENTVFLRKFDKLNSVNCNTVVSWRCTEA